MSDLHRARARAETFAHAVDHGPRHSSRLSDDPELLEAVELVGRLRTAGAVTPRPEFAAELRHRLLEQAAARAATTTPTVVRSTPSSSDDPPPREDDDASVTPITRPRHGRRIRLVASTAALVLLGGGIGSAAAAQQAMPGETLYGMKRSIENVSTQVSVGDDSRGRRELEHAMTRLAEIRALVSGGGDVTTINSTLDDFTDQARKGVSRLVASYQQDEDPASIAYATKFVQDARQALAELAPKLPPESLKNAVEALAAIEQLEQLATTACPKCERPTPPARTGGNGNGPSLAEQGPSTKPGTNPTTGPKGSSKDPTTQASTPPRVPPSTLPSADPTTLPSKVPNTVIVETPQVPPTSLKTPPRGTPRPSSPRPTLPTPSPTASWPWPIVSLPTIINLPGVIQTLLPPWK